MAEFVLKDWYNKERTFDKDVIYVQNKDGELIQFTQGNGNSKDVRYVTFLSYDGLVEYGKKAVAVGDDCADPIARGIFAKPTRESDAAYTYTFYGWATEPNSGADANWNKAITEDKTVYANFTAAVRYYTITYYDSDGTTVLKTESLAYGAMPSYKPSKTGYNFDTWSPKPSNVSGDASYTAKWIAKGNFDTMSWEEIAEIAESGNAESVFSLGDTKTETINDVEVTLRIVGFNHDDLSDGTGKAGITIMSTTTQQMEFDSRYSASSDVKWSNCDLRTYLNGEYLNMFPDDLKAVVKAVDKISDGGKNSKTLVATSDKVWIPSYEETGSILSNHVACVTAGQGTKYPGITKTTTHTLVASYNNKFWTRTMYYSGSSSGAPKVFCCFRDSPYYNYVSYNDSKWATVALFFCI